MVDDPTARFAALASQPADGWALDDAMLLVAAHAHPGLDLDAERRRLDALAAGVTEPTLAAVCRHLCVDEGFAGDRATYHDPRNSFLPDVLDRRLGIPITLAVLAMEVGRRAGVTVDGIGLPGHFVARAADTPDRYVDVFDGGRLLDEADCRRLVATLVPGVAWSDAFLAPVAPPAIVARVLANLATAYRRSGDRRGLCWVLGLRLELPGASTQERRELGVLLGASGRFDEGAAVLSASAEDRDQEAAARLRARLN